MANKHPITKPLVEPTTDEPSYADQITAGPTLLPLQRLSLYSDREWEDFITEWATSLKSDYHTVHRHAGAGDEGLDVVAYVDDPATDCEWDNYQCKHYDHALMPSDVWLELGKLCYYTFSSHYTVPRRYYFVAPKGAGTSLLKLLRKPEEIRAGLLANWDGHCAEKITSKKSIPLDAPLRAYIEGFDFSIVQAVPPLRIVEQHSKTCWHLRRFGGGLPARPPHAPPPTTPHSSETRYVRQLFDAYGDRLRATVNAIDDLSSHDGLKNHLSRSREQFYSAEALKNFSRDHLTPGEYGRLQDEIHEGVIDVAEDSHADGLVRVNETTKQARNLSLTSHPLVPRMTGRDRSGICHQLANDDRLIWVPPNV